MDINQSDIEHDMKLSDIEEEPMLLSSEVPSSPILLSPILSEIEEVLSNMEVDGELHNSASPAPSFTMFSDISDIEEPTQSDPLPRISFAALEKGSDLEDENYEDSLQMSEIEDEGEINTTNLKPSKGSLETTQYQIDDLETDDSDLSEDELEERVNCIPPPNAPDPKEIAEAKAELDSNKKDLKLLCAVLRANGQTMEDLDFIGPARKVESVPTEVFRKANKTDTIVSATAYEQLTWEDLCNRQLKIGDQVFSNHLKGRLDFGGSRASAYNLKARKIGMKLQF